MTTQTYLNKRLDLTLSTIARKADVLPSALWTLAWLTTSAWFRESRYVAIGSFRMLTYFDYRQKNKSGKQSSLIQRTISYNGADSLQDRNLLLGTKYCYY
jgi:hypothetical protein